MFVDVEERAGAEAGPLQGKPRYYGRPWSQLRDEMVASGARTVGELSTNRVAVYYHSTRIPYGSVIYALKRIFGAISSTAQKH
jgi:hypothetical protein